MDQAHLWADRHTKDHTRIGVCGRVGARERGAHASELREEAAAHRRRKRPLCQGTHADSFVIKKQYSGTVFVAWYSFRCDHGPALGTSVRFTACRVGPACRDET